MVVRFAWIVIVLAAFVGRADGVEALLDGAFDNVEQFHNAAPSTLSVPRTKLSITSPVQPNWTLWRVSVETEPGNVLEQTWAMHEEHQNGHDALVPYYQLKQDGPPDASAFDPDKWLSLEACALRGSFKINRMQGFSEGEQCVAVTMSVGARRALLPVAFETDGKIFKFDLNLRGRRTPIFARKMAGQSETDHS